MSVKLTASFFFGICALLAAICAFAQSAQVSGVYYLKVRAAPDMEAPEAGVLQVGEVVEILDEVGSWAHILFQDGRTGYASRKYLTGIDAVEAARTTTEAVAPIPVPSYPAPAAGSAPEPQGPPLRTLEPAATPPLRPQPTPIEQTQRPVPAPASSVRPSSRRAAGCTKNDLEALRNDLRALAAGQERLVALAAARQTQNTDTTWAAALPLRELLPWLGFGCVIGWVAGRVFSYRRLRRHRIRI